MPTATFIHSFSTHQNFSLLSACSVLKEVTLEAAILKLSWQPGCVYVTSFCPTQNWPEGEILKTRNWLGILHKVSKIYFSEQFSTCLSSVLSFQSLEHVWLIITWLKSSDNPEWWLKGSWQIQATWTKSLAQNDITKTRPDCWVLFEMAAMMFEIS